MAPVSAVLASIPSPPTGVYHVGPLTIHMYGVMLLLAIAACVWLTGRRWVRWGGDWDLVYRIVDLGRDRRDRRRAASTTTSRAGTRTRRSTTHWYGPFAVW